MTLSKLAATLLGAAAIATAQSDVQEIGWGPGDSPELYATANQNPLNKTSYTFGGFDFLDSANDGQWSWNAGLSTVNVDTNETNFPISSAANTTSNVINVAYSLTFPGDRLPSGNNSDWTLCAFILDVPWTDDDYKKASNDPGDCSSLLSTSCMQEIQHSWLNPSTSSCPQIAPKSGLSDCGTLFQGWTAYSAPINTVYDSANNHTIVGLKSGSTYGYVRSVKFDRSQAQTIYDDFASKLRMTIMTFAPGKNYTSPISGPARQEEVKTFCTILNKSAPRVSAANSLGINYALAYLAALPLLLLW